VRSTRFQHVFGAVGDVGVRKFLVADHDVAVAHALQRHVAVRIVLDADHALGADDRARPLQQIAFDVVVAVRDHRAVQAEQHAVERQRRAQLRQHFVAHELVVGLVDLAGRAGGKAAALDQREAVARRALARDEERRRAHPRRVVGMLRRAAGRRSP
jgi:hypothetical protein